MDPLFARYPADPDAVQGRGQGMLSAAQLVSEVKEQVSRSHRGGLENVLGVITEPFVGSLDPTVREARRLEDLAAYGCGAMGMFADAIRQFNGTVDALNVTYFVGVATGFGVPAPTGPMSADAAERASSRYRDAVQAARRGFVADLVAQEAAAETLLDARALATASMLDQGPTDDGWLTIYHSGNAPDGYLPYAVQQIADREEWETTLPNDRVLGTDYSFKESGGGIFIFGGADGHGWYVEQLADGDVRATRLNESSVSLGEGFGVRADWGDFELGQVVGAGFSKSWADSQTWVVPADELDDLQRSFTLDGLIEQDSGDGYQRPEPERVSSSTTDSWFVTAEISNRLFEAGLDLETSPTVRGSYTLANGDTGVLLGSRDEGSFHGGANVDPLGVFNIWNREAAAVADNSVDVVFSEADGLPTSMTLVSQTGEPEDFRVMTTELDLSELDDSQRHTLAEAIMLGDWPALEDVAGMGIPARTYVADVLAESRDWGFEADVWMVSASDLGEETEADYTYPAQELVPAEGD